MRLRAMTGIDFHVAVTLLLRSWGVLAGGVMVLILPSTLSSQQQGYYFTFASLLGLQIFFELGLNQVIVQIVGHEMASLRWETSGRLLGDVERINRLRSIVALLSRWYGVAATLFLIVTVAVGAVLFVRSGSLPMQAWAGPWLLLVLLTAVNLYYSPMLAILEGCGQVGQVAKLRLVQSMIGYGLTWLALLGGAALWALPILAGISVLCTAKWLREDAPLLRILADRRPVPPGHAINWKREVLPFQWRIGVSWISGYLMFQLFTPLVFVNLGAVEAGKLGIALAIFGALLSVGVSWINAKIPVFTAHVARGEREVLNRTFRGVLARCVAFTSTASALVLLSVFVLGHLGVSQIARIADLPTLACIAAVTAMNTAIYGAAAYMRAHREEPMLLASVVSAALTLFTAFFASRYGLFQTMLLQAAITLMISLPWTLVLFRGYYGRTA